MGNFSGFMNALGDAFGGYAQDQQTHIERARQAAADARQAALDAQNRQNGDFARMMQAQQAGYIPQAQDFAARTAGPAAALAQTIGGSPTAFLNPGAQYQAPGPSLTVPLSTGSQQYVYNWDRSPNGQSERRQMAEQDARERAASAAANAKEQSARKGAYTVMRASFKDEPLSAQPFDPSVDYVAALKEAQDNRRLQATLGVARARLGQQAAARDARAKVPTPDQVKSATVRDLADPAADILLAYHGGDGGARQGAAYAVGHLPLVGTYLQGKTDAAYQNAMNAARTLATQYLEIMPKSRFQPSTVDDIMSQIAPDPGDAPQKRASKLARVRTLKSAIEKRAALRPDDPGPTLDDMPDFPQPDGSNP